MTSGLPVAVVEETADVSIQDETARSEVRRKRLEAFESFLASVKKEPWRFDFFQALRTLEALRPDRPRLGKSERAVEDPIRLGQEPSLAFAPSTLGPSTAGTEGRPDRITTFFFGLFGPNGPLPLHLTEYARDRSRNEGDPTFGRFVDLFHHRMLSLFYRAWANAQPTAAYDRPQADRFAEYIGSLVGIGTPAFRERDAMPDHAKLHFVGLLAGRTRSPEGLVAILKAFFQVPVRLRQFVGHWMSIPEEYRCRLGESPQVSILGQTVTLGSRVWDCQSRFGLVLGPLSFAEYCRFLPDGSSLGRLVAIVRNAIGDELMWDVRLVLQKEEVPVTQLNGIGQLGRTVWLRTKPAKADAGDFVFVPSAAN